MYLPNTLGRGLLDFATPLFVEIEKTFDSAFAEEDGDYVFEVEMPGFSKDLSPAQIASITNYVRVTFGGLPNSDVSAADVTRVIKEKS